MTQVAAIKRKTLGFVSDPVQRAGLIHEVGAEIWKPFATPEARKAVLQEVGAQVWELFPLRDEKLRAELTEELGHRLARIIDERIGAIKGTLIKSGKAALLEGALATGNPLQLAGALPKTIELPIVGKVTPQQALQLLQGLRQQMGGGGFLPQITSGGGGGGDYPR